MFRNTFSKLDGKILDDDIHWKKKDKLYIMFYGIYCPGKNRQN